MSEVHRISVSALRGRVRRGDVYYADLGKGFGSEQSGVKLVLIIQNNTGNYFSENTIVCVITSKRKPKLPTHVTVDVIGYPSEDTSTVLVEQIRTLDKNRLRNKVGNISEKHLKEVDRAILKSLSIK